MTKSIFQEDTKLATLTCHFYRVSNENKWEIKFILMNLHRLLLMIWMKIDLLPPATKLPQGNVFTPVCHSVHGGVCHTHTDAPSRHPLGRQPQQTPPGRHPLFQADTPSPGQTPTPPGIQPPGKTPECWDMVNKWGVCILLESNLFFSFNSIRSY